MHRDGLAQWLPHSLAESRLLWQHPLPHPGIGGIAASDELVIVTARDRNNTSDVVICLDAASGVPFWQHSYPARGDLDYGNSIRATPLIVDPYVITLGAFGDLHCLDLETGEPVWSTHLVRDLGGVMPQWGYAASPIVVDDRVIVQPGGEASSIVALDVKTGSVLWKTPGRQAAYASLVEWQQGSVRQLIGLDYRTLIAWEPSQGQRLWEVAPQIKNDFNVPTPIACDRGVIVTSENNGTRLHAWSADGKIDATPAAQYLDLAGDSHSPILLGDYVVGVNRGLHVLDLRNDLSCTGTLDDPCLDGYCSLIGCEDRVLIQCEKGELLLVQIGKFGARELDRLRVAEENVQILAHPALAGKTYWVRLPDSLQAWALP